MEELIEFIENKYNEHEQAISDIDSKYEDSDMYSSDDSSMMDYHEGAVEVKEKVWKVDWNNYEECLL